MMTHRSLLTCLFYWRDDRKYLRKRTATFFSPSKRSLIFVCQCVCVCRRGEEKREISCKKELKGNPKRRRRRRESEADGKED